METKIQREFIYHGFGFPVKFKNVPMIKVRGTWTPKVDYQRIAKELLYALAFKPGRLTGHEVRFIRLEAGITLQEFGKRFDVSHVAVLKWEKAGDRVTPMAWSIEKDLRLSILKREGEGAAELAKLYAELEAVHTSKGPVLEISVGRAAA